MLKKRKHKIKRRNTEPSVNHPLVLATQSNTATTIVEDTTTASNVCDETILEHPQPTINLVDICDSPTHASAI